MFVPPWRRVRAQQEAIRRRNLVTTYTEPLGIHPSECSDDGFEAVKNFLNGYYKRCYTKQGREENAKTLRDYPEVAAHFATLVKMKSDRSNAVFASGSHADEDATSVSEEEFWQRFEFRCDVERILAEWARSPPEKEPLSVAFERSIGSIRNVLAEIGQQATAGTGGETPLGSPTKPSENTDMEAEKVLSAGSVRQLVLKSEQGLESSLQAAMKDVVNWSMEDSTKAEETKKQIETEKEEPSTSKAQSNWLDRLIHPQAAGPGAASVKDPSIKEEVEVDTEVKVPASAVDFFFALPKEQGIKTRSFQTSRRVESRAETKRKPAPAPAPAPPSANDSKVKEEPPTENDHSLSEKPANIIARVKARLAEYDNTTVLVMALLTGFLANVILGRLFGAFCSTSYVHNAMQVYPHWTSPSGVQSSVVGMVCGDPSRTAVQVFDFETSESGMGRQQARRRGSTGNRRYSNQPAYGPGGSNDGDVGSLMSSWMQNADFSQFAHTASQSSNNIQVNPKKKRRGLLGFLRRKFKRKSNALAQPGAEHDSNTIVHQHVHHVVHHVVSE